MTDQATLDRQCIDTMRFLAADAVQKANSGHPGAPMGAAPMAYVLWDRFLRHNPANPAWPGRDRFVLSAGHASMLLYALLHLTGYDLPLAELKNFRQWGSRTPGHPEHGEIPGVETTTGPLGQGFANGVGMAVAERRLAAQFNRPGHAIVDHFTYGIVSDGDLQEGLTAEATGLAGTWKLGRLIYLYDDNGIQIEGRTAQVFTDDVAARFTACLWQVIGPIDGSDCAAVDAAIREAQGDAHRPSLIICKTVIGYGSPNQGTAKVHGEPLGEENLRTTKDTLGWPQEPLFHVPEIVARHMREAVARGGEIERDWQQRFEAYAKEHPELAHLWESQIRGELPSNWESGLVDLFAPDAAPMATRSASGKILNLVGPRVPALMGGSADLAPSNKTRMTGAGDFGCEDYGGRNMHFGVREHAMAAIAGGMALHGGIIPYVATFLTFSDYMRPSIRLAALMGLRVIYVFTHDSIGLGEDGPTHQPIEHLMALRMIPNLTVIRPADALETAAAWTVALQNTGGPTALLFTRQNVPTLERAACATSGGTERGAYTLWQSSGGIPDLILIGTGSETQLALAAGRTLAEQGHEVRVVSMPSWELFDQQPADYRESVFPREVSARVAVEAGIRIGWERYVGLQGDVVGLDRFGASAPAHVLYEKLDITVEHVIRRAKAISEHQQFVDNAPAKST